MPLRKGLQRGDSSLCAVSLLSLSLSFFSTLPFSCSYLFVSTPLHPFLPSPSQVHLPFSAFPSLVSHLCHFSVDPRVSLTALTLPSLRRFPSVPRCLTGAFACKVSSADRPPFHSLVLCFDETQYLKASFVLQEGTKRVFRGKRESSRAPRVPHLAHMPLSQPWIITRNICSGVDDHRQLAPPDTTRGPSTASSSSTRGV